MVRRGEASRHLRDSARCRHRRCLGLLGEQGHQALQGALLGRGEAQGLVLLVPEKLQRQRARRGPRRVLQVVGVKEAQGRVLSCSSIDKILLMSITWPETPSPPYIHAFPLCGVWLTPLIFQVPASRPSPEALVTPGSSSRFSFLYHGTQSVPFTAPKTFCPC